MVLPLIPLALISTGVGTGMAGALNGVAGAMKLRGARSIAEAAKGEYHGCLALTGRTINATDGRIRRYGGQQGHARRHVVIRKAEVIRRNQRQVS